MFALTSKSAMKRKKAEISCIAPGRGQVERTGTQNHCGSTKVLFNAASSVFEVHTILHTIIMPFQTSVLFYIRLRTSTKKPPKTKIQVCASWNILSIWHTWGTFLTQFKLGWPAHHIFVWSRHWIHSAQPKSISAAHQEISSMDQSVFQRSELKHNDEEDLWRDFKESNFPLEKQRTLKCSNNVQVLC